MSIWDNTVKLALHAWCLVIVKLLKLKSYREQALYEPFYKMPNETHKSIAHLFKWRDSFSFFFLAKKDPFKVIPQYVYSHCKILHNEVSLFTSLCHSATDTKRNPKTELVTHKNK